MRDEPLDRLRRTLYRRAILVAVVGNVLLAAAKGVVAWGVGSSAVLSDAANSLSDIFYSLFMAVGLCAAQQPADECHPQGHSRFEPLVSLLITVAMGVAGIGAAREGLARFRSGGTAVAPTWPTVVLLASALAKIVMYKIVTDLGHRASSPALQASARDNLADVLGSVVAWLGVLGSRVVHPLLDPIAGVGVALWIFGAVWGILAENLGYLTGRGASPEVVEDIVAAASAVPCVVDAHRVIADYVGSRLRVEMHICVDGEMMLHEAHAVGERVRGTVESLPSVDLAFVHVEPGRDQP